MAGKPMSNLGKLLTNLKELKVSLKMHYFFSMHVA